jgi:hypothetical protein
MGMEANDGHIHFLWNGIIGVMDQGWEFPDQFREHPVIRLLLSGLRIIPRENKNIHFHSLAERLVQSTQDPDPRKSN